MGLGLFADRRCHPFKRQTVLTGAGRLDRRRHQHRIDQPGQLELHEDHAHQRLYVRAAGFDDEVRRLAVERIALAVKLLERGARVRALVPLRAGHTVWLRLPRLEPIEARVVWTSGCETGCEFVRALHPAVFETISHQN